jgi:hypothetical protein
MKERLIIGILLIISCGCSQPKASSSKPWTPIPTPTPCGIGQSSTDGNLRLTVTEAWTIERVTKDTKLVRIQLNIENINPQKTYEILGSDFSSSYPAGYGIHCLGGLQIGANWDKEFLGPGQTITGTPFCFTIPLEMKYVTFSFDFSGPNGKSSGGPIARFRIPVE